MRKKRPASTRESAATDDNPFRINISFKSPLRRKLLGPSSKILERVFLMNHLEKLYGETLERPGGDHFLHKLMEQMNVSYKVSDKDIARIPKTGPVVVVANHPYGGIESVILSVVLRSVRPDVKMMANSLLGRVPEVRDYCFFVDPFGGKEAAKRNIGVLKETARWIRDGGMLGVFPAGEVSHVSLRNRGVIDKKWSTSIGRLIRMTEAPVVPMFIEGHNGPLFQVAGMIHPRLRTAMLPHELLNKRNRCVGVSVGKVIPYEDLSVYSSDSDVMEYLQFRTYVLENKKRPSRRERKKRIARGRSKKQQEIAPPGSVDLMAAEVDQLSDKQLIVSSGDMDAYVARASEIRHVIHEIGRLREISFRKEGEGSGKRRDLDRFDDYYLHLFVWNRKKREIVGAYRLGPTDEILASHGKRGLYTSTLFKYKKALLKEIGPALELGRSFVRPEYQRNYSSLLLLWKGICHFVAMNPKYRNLFGPVSISNDYRSVSRLLLTKFLKVNKFEKELARLIKAKHPIRSRPIKACAPTLFDRAVKDIGTISSVISEIEGDKKGVPILLKQYLKLGGKLLGFNRDPDFCDVLDGLILVDFLHADRKQLQRFMSKDGLKSFLAYHGVESS